MNRIRQVIYNLVNNAIKYSDEGSVVISVNCDSCHNPESQVHIRVQDTGIGISPYEQASIFDKFTQADSGSARGKTGSGLGLAICQQLVSLIGGEIGVESVLNQGSTFWVSLPMIVFQQYPASSEIAGTYYAQYDLPTQKYQHNTENKTPAVRNLKILLVEDNLINQNVSLYMLRKLEHSVEIAANGLEAVEMARNFTYDIILMDCQMPHMDGYEATRVIREWEKPLGKHTPIVAMTAHAMTGDQEKCLQVGMDGYIAKPIKKADLQEALHRLTSHFRQSSCLLTAPHTAYASYNQDRNRHRDSRQGDFTRDADAIICNRAGPFFKRHSEKNRRHSAPRTKRP